jgi:hypothetical protein
MLLRNNASLQMMQERVVLFGTKGDGRGKLSVVLWPSWPSGLQSRVKESELSPSGGHRGVVRTELSCGTHAAEGEKGTLTAGGNGGS